MGTTVIEYQTPDAGLLKRAADLRETAKVYVTISDPEIRIAASQDLKRVKQLAAELDEQEKEITRPIERGLKGVRDLFRAPKQWLADAEQSLKIACRRWDDEQERLRREALADATRKADEERARLARIAENEREKGNVETARTIDETATLVAPVPVAAAPKIEGESTRELWRANVDDMRALCRAIGAGHVPPDLVVPNYPVLNGLARSLKASINIPGVRAYAEKILAARR